MISINGEITIEQGHFPDHTLLMKFEPKNSWADNDIYITWKYENDAELFALICVKRHLDKFYNHNNITLAMSYLPHARQDRVKNNEDVFTLKYFCEIINSLKFKTVYVRDVHSNVSLALLDNVVNGDPSMYIHDAIENSNAEVLFYPDEGAMKRYSECNPMIYAFGIKKRDWQTGKIQGLQIVNADLVKDKTVLIVDDICSRGGTFYYSAKALKEAGAANINLYITHCENTILEGEIFTSGLINNVYTTNSLVHCDELKEKLIYV